MARARPCSPAYATANMTAPPAAARRRLGGAGAGAPRRPKVVELPRGEAVEIRYLALATLYSFVDPACAHPAHRRHGRAVLDLRRLRARPCAPTTPSARWRACRRRWSSSAPSGGGWGAGVRRSRGVGDPDRRRAVRREPDPYRQELGDRGVPAGAVAGAAGLGVARVHRGAALLAEGLPRPPASA